MGSKNEHLQLVSENGQLAKTMLASADPTMQRWGVVVAYYSMLHLCHAIADEQWGEHPEDHPGVWEIPARVDPSNSRQKAEMNELYQHSHRARYLKASGARADKWFEPLWHTAPDAVRKAGELLESLDRDLRRIGGL